MTNRLDWDESPPTGKKNILRGAVVLLIVLAIAAGVWRWLSRRSAVDHDTEYAAFFSSRVDVVEDQPVTYRRKVVGVVTGITRSFEGLQLTILAHHVPEVPEVVTLRPGEHAVVREVLTITLKEEARAELTTRAGTITAQRMTDGGWTLDSSVPAVGIRRNGRPILVKAGEVATVRAGDRLEFVDSKNGFELVWGDVDFHTRVAISIDTSKFAREAKEAGYPPATRLAPGSRVVFLTGLGNPKPRLEIQPSLSADQAAVMHRDAAGKMVDSPELVPAETADPLAAVAALTGYLTSPQGLRQPPANRAERLVADLNVTAAEASELAAQFNAAGHGEDPGVALRLLLDEPGLRDVANITGRLSAASAPLPAASANFRAASASLASTAGWVSATTRDTTQRGELLRQLLDRGYGSLLSSLSRADSLTGAANGLVAGVARDSAKLDSTIHSVHRLTARLAADTGKIDSTITSVQGITRKVNSPGLPIVGIGIGVAILNGIKSLFQ
jgi:hypothetical protein